MVILSQQVRFCFCLVLFQAICFSSNLLAQVTPQDGNWAAKTLSMTNTPEADLMVRVGDIDNLGFGWPSGFNPFTGRSTPVHAHPPTDPPGDPAGTDQIMVVTSYSNSPPAGADNYTLTTSRPSNDVETVTLTYGLPGVPVNTAVFQIFVDDFQAPVWHANYRVLMNDVRAPFLEEVINSLIQTGPIGRMITVAIPSNFLALVQSGTLSLNIDDVTTGAGDGYAIDFVKLLINPHQFSFTGVVSGLVLDSLNHPVPHAVVTTSSGVKGLTDTNGAYTLTGVPAGTMLIRATKPGYASVPVVTNLTADTNLIVHLNLDLPVVGILEVLNLTNQWKYNQAGMDLGTSWRTTNYNDAAWATGRGLFYIETATLPAAKNTPLTFTNPRQTTFYFRSHFQIPSNANALVLTSSNLIDDGAVFYINGQEAARIGMSNGPVSYATLAERTVDNATNFDVITFPNTNLVVGDNFLAVEVHQHATDSSDIVFGTTLHAAFTRQVPMHPRLAAPIINKNVIHLTGFGEPGYSHVLEVSTNLSNWVPSRTNTDLMGGVQFDLPFIQVTGARFYRMRVIDGD